MLRQLSFRTNPSKLLHILSAVVNMSYAMLHLSAKDKAVRLMLDLVDKEVIAELTSLIK
jgi:hypothetical protein